MVLAWVFDPKRELLYNVYVINYPCLVCAARDQIRNMTVTVTPHFFHEMFSHTSDSVVMLTVEKNAVKYAKNVPQHPCTTGLRTIKVAIFVITCTSFQQNLTLVLSILALVLLVNIWLISLRIWLLSGTLNLPAYDTSGCQFVYCLVTFIY